MLRKKTMRAIIPLRYLATHTICLETLNPTQVVNAWSVAYVVLYFNYLLIRNIWDYAVQKVIYFINQFGSISFDMIEICRISDCACDDEIVSKLSQFLFGLVFYCHKLVHIVRNKLL